MKRDNYKILLFSIISLLLVYIVYFVFYLIDTTDRSRNAMAPSEYDVIIVNNNAQISESSAENPDIYNLACLVIKNISFASDEKYLYIKYKLAGPLPSNIEEITKTKEDELNLIYYKLFFDENYFDLSGNKNPTVFESELVISPYGRKENTETGKITVEGEMIKGGPGHDYIVVRYPYYSILLSQITDFVVFSSFSTVDTLKYPQGLPINHFENYALLADKNPREIKIDLTIKKSEAQEEENIRY